MNPDHDPHDPGRVAQYEASAPYRCFACTELARAQRQYEKAAGESELPGTKWIAELVPVRRGQP